MNDDRQMESALGEVIRVAAMLVRGDGLPSEEGERIGKRQAASIRRNALRRGVMLKDAVDAIRAEAAQLRDNLRQRIATLERERDEARAAYCALRDLVERGDCRTWKELERALREFVDKPEWRKGGA